METFSALLAALPVTGEFPAHRPVTRSFDVFFDLCQNNRLSRQWWGQLVIWDAIALCIAKQPDLVPSPMCMHLVMPKQKTDPWIEWHIIPGGVCVCVVYMDVFIFPLFIN